MGQEAAKKRFDAQFNLRALIPNYQEYFDDWAGRSDRTRRKRTGYVEVGYGQGPLERLDVFPSSGKNAPVVVFIHGGYWQALDKRECSFIAEGFVPFGMNTVILNYPLAPRASMDEIVKKNREALATIFTRAREFGGDGNRIYLIGHSAGGHLLAMLMATTWPELDPRLPPDVIKGGCAVSGLFDLEPIRLSYLNEVLKMDERASLRNSPIHALPRKGVPLILCVGELETEEYHRQSSEYGRLWKDRGFPLEELVVPGRHHYDMMGEVADQKSLLNRTIRKRILSLFP